MSKRELNTILASYKEAEAREKEAKAEKEKYKALIIKEMKDAENMSTGLYKVSNTSYERTSFDSKTFQESHKRLFEKFKTIITCTRFSVVEI